MVQVAVPRVDDDRFRFFIGWTGDHLLDVAWIDRESSTAGTGKAFSGAPTHAAATAIISRSMSSICCAIEPTARARRSAGRPPDTRSPGPEAPECRESRSVATFRL